MLQEGGMEGQYKKAGELSVGLTAPQKGRKTGLDAHERVGLLLDLEDLVLQFFLGLHLAHVDANCWFARKAR